MFEEELRLERRSSNVLPLLLIVGLMVLVVGTVIYTIFQVKEGKKAPSSEDATRLVTSVLAARRQATTEFRTGLVKPRPNDTVSEPNYRLLESAGVVKIKKDKTGAGTVTLTPQGEQALAAVTGVKQAKNKDGSVTYTVPLGERKLVQVAAVTMERPNVARVDFTWQWTVNSFGDLFDATGPAAMKMTLWDRASLIQKHGADLFHAPPAKESVRVLHTEKGWIVSPD